MTKQGFEKWLNNLIKPNLENLVGLAPTMGASEKYEHAYNISDSLCKAILEKLEEIE